MQEGNAAGGGASGERKTKTGQQRPAGGSAKRATENRSAVLDRPTVKVLKPAPPRQNPTERGSNPSRVPPSRTAGKPAATAVNSRTDKGKGPKGPWLDGLLALVETKVAELIEREPNLEHQDPEALADLMLSAVPAKHGLDQKLGPFYDTEGMMKWFGVTRQALHDRAKKGTLLSVVTSDRHRLYPQFQFTHGREVLPALPEIIKILRTGTDSEWTIAGWMRGEVEELDGLDAATYLASGADPALVINAARETAGRWRA